MENIGETGRKFGVRYKEHLRKHYPIFNYSQNTGHLIKLENFSIVDRESQDITRSIKEAMYIRVNYPLQTGTLENTSCTIFGMDCCRICQLSIYSDPIHQSHYHPTLGHLLPQIKKGHKILPWGKYVPPRGSPLLHLFPILHFGIIFFRTNFGTKLVGITFFSDLKKCC